MYQHLGHHHQQENVVKVIIVLREVHLQLKIHAQQVLIDLLKEASPSVIVANAHLDSIAVLDHLLLLHAQQEVIVQKEIHLLQRIAQKVHIILQ